MIWHAVEQEKDQAAWEVWVQLYPHFTEESFKSFSDFKKEVLGNRTKATNLSYKEITDEISELVAQYEMKGE